MGAHSGRHAYQSRDGSPEVGESMTGPSPSSIDLNRAPANSKGPKHLGAAAMAGARNLFDDLSAERAQSPSTVQAPPSFPQTMPTTMPYPSTQQAPQPPPIDTQEGTTACPGSINIEEEPLFGEELTQAAAAQAREDNGKKVTYYGYIEEIWELDYGPNFKVPLFRCKWFNLKDGVQVDPQYGMTTVDLKNLGYDTEPFVLASEVAQVFYVKDMSSKPKKRKERQEDTSYDEPKRHIVLSGKRNIVGVEDKTDMSEDYNKFDDIPPFKCAGISMDEVKKKLFSMSLSGKAAHWYKLLKDGRSLDWKDIVPLFYSKFYPPSEIHKDRNRIYNFWPHDGENIAQAWERLKSLMLKCPNHELPGNIIIDNFYARLSFQDKTLLDTTCSGSFTRNKEEFKRDLLDRIKENTEDWENDKGKESGYADKPPFKPLPPKEGSEEREEEKKKKKGTKKKKKKKENKKKECFRSGQWGSQAAKVHKLGAYDGVIRLARAHLGLSATLLRANMPLLRPFFSFVLATTGDTVPSGASPATELLERMRSRDLMCGPEGLD
ncbi:hypothetical protein QYE76_050402 [Lolium multiflorum]|uniref:Uncharacterized protein n=1 Tax=Lolium multiflorum TaxID=4521 RepID=A0AAD8WJ68_LOLMU|nr:hypothetical protein QYE76_050402 [Lolium multiflorum]